MRKSIFSFLFPSRTASASEPEPPVPTFNHGLRFVDKDYSDRVIEQVNGKTGSGLVRRKQHTYANGGDRLNERPLDDWLKDVPRYPPYPNAIPAAPAETILISQTNLLHDLAVGFGQNDELFQAIIMPVVRNFVDWVHLLPASKAHHHCGLGGAYRHALETATTAAKLIRNEVPNPSIRKRDEAQYDKRLRAAAIISGLLHDAGKPISDVALIDPSGNKEWNPNSRSIVDWVNREGITSYYIQWRDKRYGNHELFSGRMLDRIVPDSVMEWLDEFGPGLQVWMAEAVTGIGDRQVNPIHKVVRIADESSAAKDISSDHRLNGGSLGIPMEQNIIDAMRRILHSDMWVVNEKGSPLWVDQEQQVYLIWSRAAADIVHRLHEDKIKGILRDPDSIGEALFETGILVPNPYAEDCQIHPMYWLIQPAELAGNRPDRPTVNVAVKLADPSLLFASQANPRVTRIKIYESDPRQSGKKPPKIPIAEIPADQVRTPSVADSAPTVVTDADPVDVELDHRPFEEGQNVATPPSNEEQSDDTPAVGVDLESRTFWQAVDAIDGTIAEHCLAYAGEGPLRGLPALTFPAPGRSEDESIALLEKLADQDLVATDPANPLRQVHSANGAEWIVLAAPRRETDVDEVAAVTTKARMASGGDQPPPKDTGYYSVTGGDSRASQPRSSNDTQGSQPSNVGPSAHMKRSSKKPPKALVESDLVQKKKTKSKPKPRKPVNEQQLDIFSAAPPEKTGVETYRIVMSKPVALPKELAALNRSFSDAGSFTPSEPDGRTGKLSTNINSLLNSIVSDPSMRNVARAHLIENAPLYADFMEIRLPRLLLNVTKETPNA